MPEEQKILLDTNFLLIPAQFGVDIFTELQRVCDFRYKLYIFDSTLKELENIGEKQKGKQKEAAKITLLLIKNKNINIIPADSAYVDKAVLGLPKGYIIATQDFGLKAKLKEKGFKIITLRQKKYLEMK